MLGGLLARRRPRPGTLLMKENQSIGCTRLCSAYRVLAAGRSLAQRGCADGLSPSFVA